MTLAQALDGEIVNADSVQLYKDFDIGSAKPSLEERGLIEHHLVDQFHWSEDCDAAKFSQIGRDSIRSIANRKKLPLLVGGAGLYLRSLWGERFDQLPTDHELKASLNNQPTHRLYEDLLAVDPNRAKEIHPNDKFRIVRALEIKKLTGKSSHELWSNQGRQDFPPSCILLMEPIRELLHKKIEQRVDLMLSHGFVEEVVSLLRLGCPQHNKTIQSIGYKQVVAYINGDYSFEELRNRIIFATRQYAKRQITWFKKVKIDIRITGLESQESIIDQVHSFLER